MKAVAYVRVSQEDEDVENQVNAILEWAKTHGYNVVGVFKENAVSGSIPPREREKYRSMIEFAKDNNIRTILFYDLSRLSRSLEDGLNELKSLSEEGFEFKFVAQEFLDYIADPMLRKKVISDFLWFAELYREDIRRRTIEALRRKRKEGVRLGRPPYNIPVTDVKNMLSKGYKIADIHRILVLQGKICRKNNNGERKCMSYESFRRRVRDVLKQ